MLYFSLTRKVEAGPLLPLIFVLTFFLSMLGTALRAQSPPAQSLVKAVIPPSPEATSLGKFGEIPVGYYTGVPNISIPIYTITSRDITVPISLNYHAGGIRVQEDASWVGLGWGLQAGGTISRTIRGSDDLFYEKGYAYQKEIDNVSNTLAAEIGQGSADGEPDLFMLSLPNGTSLKFVIAKEQPNPNTKLEGTILTPTDNTKIVGTKAADGNYYWQVTTPDGFIYKFGSLSAGGIEKAITLGSSYEAFSDPGVTTTGPTNGYVTAWNLVEILSPTNEKVTFEYRTFKSKTLVIPTQEVNQINPGFNGDPSCLQEFSNNFKDRFYFSRQVITHAYLSKINFANGSVIFDTDRPSGETIMSREDIEFEDGSNTNGTANPGAQKLRNIVVQDINGTKVKKWTFFYNYFSSTSCCSDNSAYNTKRLRLDAVQEVDPYNNKSCLPPHKLYYKGYDYTNNVYDKVLPAKKSQKYDEYGYYNGKTGNEGLNHIIPYTQVKSLDKTVTFPGTVNRDADINFSEIGTLDKVVYPTGGTSQFTYESHRGIVNENTLMRRLDASRGETKLTLAVTSSINIQAYFSGDPRTTDPATGSVYCQSIQNQVVPGATKWLVVKNSSNVEVFSLTYSDIYNATNQGSCDFQFNRITNNLPAGDYTVILSPDYARNSTKQHTAKAIIYYVAATDNLSAVVKDIGGLRIKEITNNDGSNSYKKAFTYNGGRAMSPVRHGYPRTIVQNYNDGIPGGGSICSISFVTFTSSSVIPLSGSAQGGYVGYDSVSVVDMSLVGGNWVAQNGKTLYTFSNTVDALSRASYLLPNFPVYPFTNNGRPIKEQVINSSNKAVKVIEYEDEKVNFGVIKGFVPYQTAFSTTLPNFDLAPYFISIDYWKTKKITTKQFDLAGIESTTVTAQNSYNNLYKQIEEVITYNSRNEEKKVQYKYPYHYGNTEPYKTMWSVQNRISPIIEENTYLAGVRINTNRTSYKQFSNSQLILPDQSFSKRKDETTDVVEATYDFDANGNLASVLRKDGLKNQYTWYPSTPKKNYMSSQSLESGTGLVLEKKNYDYYPLKGISKITDINDFSENYVYDAFSRLTAIKDHDQNLVKTYHYNYSPEGCRTKDTPIGPAPDEPEDNFSVTPTTISAASTASTFTVTVSSNLPAWTVSENMDWISVSPSSGANTSTFTVTVAANTTDSPRTGLITVSGSGMDQYVRVTQLGVASGNTTLALQLREVVSNGSGGQMIGPIIATLTNGSTVLASQLSGKTVNLYSQVLGNHDAIAMQVTTPANTSFGWGPDPVGNQTSGLYGWQGPTGNYNFATGNYQVLTYARLNGTVVAGSQTQPINFSISSSTTTTPSLTISPSGTQNVGSASGSLTVTITASNLNWTASSSDASWLSLNSSSGSGSGSRTLSYTANPNSSSRSATVTFTGSGITRTLTITQAGTTASNNPVTTSESNGVYYLQNALVKVGIGLNKGGSIVYLSKIGQPNMVNNADLGRQIQPDYYQGPHPYSQNGKDPHPTWVKNDYNTTYAGDTYNNACQVSAYSYTNGELYVRLTPLLWPLNNEVSQVMCEAWYSLVGNRVHARYRFTNQRTDGYTTFDGRGWAIPVMYLNNDYNKCYTYSGTAPFTNGGIIQTTNLEGPQIDNGFNAQEKWAILTNSSGEGAGIYVNRPDLYWYSYWKSPNQGSGENDAATTLLEATFTTKEPITPNYVFNHEADIIVGTVQDVRSYAYSQNTSSVPTCGATVSAKASAQSVSCGTAVTLSATCSGSNCSGMTYSWSGNGISQSGQSISVTPPPADGSYTYTVTATKNGCSQSATTSAITVSGCGGTGASGCSTFAEVCSGNNSEVRSQTLNVAKAGTYSLIFTYKAHEKVVDGTVWVNGTPLEVNFGLVTTYQDKIIGQFSLNAGDNTINFCSGADGGVLCVNKICYSTGNGTPPSTGGSTGGSGGSPNPGSCSTFAEVCSGNNSEVRSQTINVATAGSYSLILTYKSHEKAVSGTVWVNGTAQPVSFAQVSTYQDKVIGTVSLSAGNNTINFASGSDGGILCVNKICWSNGSTGGSTGGSGGSTTTGSCSTFAEVCSGNNSEVRSQTINVTTAGNYPLVLTYKSHEKAVSGTVWVNGTAQPVSFAQVSTYQDKVVGTVYLSAGNNVINFASGTDGGVLCVNKICWSTSSSSSCNQTVGAAASASSVSCGGSVTLSASCSGSDCSGVSYSWSGNGISQSGQNVTITAPSTTGSYTYTVTASKNGCSSATAQVALAVSCVSNNPNGSYEGFFEGADCSMINGWVWDATQPNAPVAVEILANNVVIATVVASSYRSDLESAGKGNGQHAFWFTTPSSLKTGQSQSLSARPQGKTTLLQGSPRSINCTAPSGCNFNVAASTSASNASCGGSVTLSANCSGSDCSGVSYSWSGNGISQSGQNVTITAPSTAGSYTYTVTASKNGCSSATAQVTFTVSCVSNNSNANYEGFFEGADCSMINGWVWDPSQPNAPVAVEILANNVVIATVVASSYRSDLQSAGKGNGQHAFWYPTPSSLKTGQSQSLSARPQGKTTLLQGSPRSISCVPVSGCNFNVAASTSASNVSCGSSVTLSGGCSGSDCSGVSYSWSGNGISQSGQNVTITAPSTAGSYTYTVTAAKSGCSSATAQVTLNVSGCGGTNPGNCSTFADMCSGNNSEVRSQTINVATAGNYSLVLTYKSHEKAVNGTVWVNGAAQPVSFAQSSSYQSKVVGTVYLSAGNNTINYASGTDGGMLCVNKICVQ